MGNATIEEARKQGVSDVFISGTMKTIRAYVRVLKAQIVNKKPVIEKVNQIEMFLCRINISRFKQKIQDFYGEEHEVFKLLFPDHNTLGFARM